MQSKKPLSYFKERLYEELDWLGLNRSFKRDLLLEVLYELDGPASVETIHTTINKGSNRLVSVNSIYRNIKLFIELRLAMRIEHEGTVEYAISHLDDIEIRLVCSKCGMRKLAGQKDDVRHELSKMLEIEGFYSDAEGIEIVTLCKRCAV